MTDTERRQKLETRYLTGLMRRDAAAWRAHHNGEDRKDPTPGSNSKDVAADAVRRIPGLGFVLVPDAEERAD